jgi:hypothetical protein
LETHYDVTSAKYPLAWTIQKSSDGSLAVMDSTALGGSAATLYYGDPAAIASFRNTVLPVNPSADPALYGIKSISISGITRSGTTLTLDLGNLLLSGEEDDTIAGYYPWRGPREIHVTNYNTLVLVGSPLGNSINEEPLRIVTDVPNIHLSGNNYRRIMLIDSRTSTSTLNFASASSWYGAYCFPYGVSITGSASSIYGTLLAGGSIAGTTNLTLLPDTASDISAISGGTFWRFTPAGALIDNYAPAPILAPRMSWIVQ